MRKFGAERVVRLFERLFGYGVAFGKVLAHANGLGTLAGK